MLGDWEQAQELFGNMAPEWRAQRRAIWDESCFSNLIVPFTKSGSGDWSGAWLKIRIVRYNYWRSVKNILPGAQEEV